MARKRYDLRDTLTWVGTSSDGVVGKQRQGVDRILAVVLVGYLPRLVEPLTVQDRHVGSVKQTSSINLAFPHYRLSITCHQPIHHTVNSKQHSPSLHNHFGLGSCAAAVLCVKMTGELELFVGRKLQDSLEALANSHQDVASLLRGAALAAGSVTIAAAGNGLANGAGPHTDTEEGLADVHNNAHDLVVVLALEGLTNGSQHGVQPHLVNVDVALVAEGVRPLAAVLVLGILPLGADVLLEKVVVGLEGQLRDRGNIVLNRRGNGSAMCVMDELLRRGRRNTYINTPELLNRVKGNNFFQEVVPVVALSVCQHVVLSSKMEAIVHHRQCHPTFPLAGLVNHRVHLCISGCLTVKFSLSWKTVMSSILESAVSALLPPSGEMGMVVRSTCAAMVTDL